MADEQNNVDEMLSSLEGEQAEGEEAKEEKTAEGEDKKMDTAEKNAAVAEAFKLSDEQQSNLSMILDLPLKVTVELGRSRVLIQDILQYGQGSVVELNKKAGDPLEITVNNQLIAKGEVVVVNEKFAVRILEIVDPVTRIKKMGAAGKDSTQVLNNAEVAGEAEAGSETEAETKEEPEKAEDANA